MHEPNEGFVWDGEEGGEGLTWGGCVESIDEMLRHGIQIPSLEEFERVVLIMETSEEIPSSGYVFRVFRALGERGILERVQGVLVGRANAWNFIVSRTLQKRRPIAPRSRQRLCTRFAHIIRPFPSYKTWVSGTRVRRYRCRTVSACASMGNADALSSSVNYPQRGVHHDGGKLGRL